MNLIKKWILIPAGFAALMILPLSCASTPETPVEAADEAVETPAEETVEASGSVQEPDTINAETMEAAKTTANTAREKAIQAKAPKAVADQFEEAEELLASAESYAAGSDYTNAVSEYNKATAAYESAAARAGEKKAEALAAMKAADEAIANVEKNADEATRAATEGE